MKRSTIALIGLVAVGVLAVSSIFIVDEREKALVLQFGQVKSVHEEPGIYFKIPLIQEVVSYDGRILSLPTPPAEITLDGDRRLVVSAFARWQISDLVRFREAVGVEGVRAAQGLLGNIMNNKIRAVLGGVTYNAVLSEDRTGLMNRIRDEARREAQSIGVEIIDVRLTQTDLPQQNLAATFGRMRSEREREAADEIARGNEAAQRIQALADRTVVELVSDARRQSEVVRGEADAERNRIYAEAYGQDPEFFAFIRSMSAYENSMNDGKTSLVMSPDSEFFDFFRSDSGPAGGTDQGAGPATGAGTAAGTP